MIKARTIKANNSPAGGSPSTLYVAVDTLANLYLNYDPLLNAGKKARDTTNQCDVTAIGAAWLPDNVATSSITSGRLNKNNGGYSLTLPGELLVDTSAVGAAGFSLGGATNTKADNTSTVWWAGSSSVDMVNTGGSFATLNATRTLTSPHAALTDAPNLMVPVWVEDFTKINTISIQLSMGDAAFTNYYSFNYNIGSGGPSYTQRNGWHIIRIGASDWVATGSPSWTMTINAIRYRWTNASGQNNSRICIDDVYLNRRSKAKVILMTDRQWSDTFTKWRPLLMSLGLRGTVAINSSEVGITGHMSISQIQQMINEGFTICTRNPVAFNTLTVQQCVDVVAAEQSYIRTNFGLAGEDGCRFHVYANGIYYPSGGAIGDMTVVNRLHNELGILGARTTDTTNFPAYLALGADGIPPNILTAPIIGGWNGNTLTSLVGSIDVAIARGDGCIYFNHLIEDSVNSLEYAETVRRFFEYISAKKAVGLIDDVTWSEFYDDVLLG